MKLLRCLMATSLLVVAAIAAHAQFFTIQSDNDTSVLSRDPYASENAPQKESFDDTKAVQTSAKEACFSFAECSQPSYFDTKLAQKEPAPKSVQEKASKKSEKNYVDGTRKGSKMAVLPAICMTDSLLLSIIKKQASPPAPLQRARVALSVCQ